MKSYVVVKFKPTDTKTYTYVAEGAVEELEEYTHAVVDSLYGSYTVVEIVKFDTLDASTYEGQYKECVALFNETKYKNSLDRERRKKALEKELRKRVQEKSLVTNFEKLLEGDEEGMKLLEEFKSL